ncbi:MAG: NUDIX hydrolase [Acidobacteria bacterium]|nr:MAG: NUDIX hydrolase [Acidobacteriota bacterium]GIK77617.1 MAG: DNA mismatch repair protein MutT [Actinomycetes bacterium]
MSAAGGEEPVRAAGGVVIREGRAGAEVAVVHRPRYDDWSLPKGKLDPGEGFAAGALREVEEETGLSCELGDELSPARYRDARGRPKLVRYWLMTVRGGAFTPNDEVDALEWLPLAEASVRLDYEHDRRLLAEAGAAAG